MVSACSYKAIRRDFTNIIPQGHTNTLVRAHEHTHSHTHAYRYTL